MVKRVITEVKKRPIYGNIINIDNGWYTPYIGSKLYVKIFGLFWIRYKKSIWSENKHSQQK